MNRSRIGRSSCGAPPVLELPRHPLKFSGYGYAEVNSAALNRLTRKSRIRAQGRATPLTLLAAFRFCARYTARKTGRFLSPACMAETETLMLLSSAAVTRDVG